MGHIKTDGKNSFNTKKDTCHILFHSKQLFGACHICCFDLLSLIYIDLRCGVGWNLFGENSKGRGRVSSQVLMIIHVVFVATELHPDTIFSLHFLTQKQYATPLSLKVSRKALALLKQIGIQLSPYTLLTLTRVYTLFMKFQNSQKLKTG